MTDHEPAKWLLRSWRGEEPLHRVFWFYAVPINLVFYICGAVAGYFSATSTAASVAIVAIAPIYLVFLIWLGVALWRCAFNTEWIGWGYLSRIWVILMVVGVSMQLMLLVQELMPSA